MKGLGPEALWGRGRTDGNPKTPPLAQEWGNAAGALETATGDAGGVPKMPFADAAAPRVPHLRDLRGS